MAEEKVLSEEDVRKEVYAEVLDGVEPVIETATEPVEPVEEIKEPEQPQEEIEPEIKIDPIQEQLKSIADQVAVLGNIENRLKQTERRIGSMQNKFNEQDQVKKETPSEEELAVIEKDKAAWEELNDAGWGDAIDRKIANNKADQPDLSGIQESIDSVKGDMITNAALEQRLVNFQHPGWQTVVETSDYKSWVTQQDQVMQQKAYYGQSAEDAIHVLNEFKKSQQSQKTEKITQSRDQRLEKSIDRSTNRQTRPPKSEANMTDAEYRAKITRKKWG